MASNKKELKMNLQELRALIDIDKSEWVNIDTTNCYAYALGLDIPEYKIRNAAYVPGVIANSNIFLRSQKIFSYDDLLNNMYLDFNGLGIDFREIKPLDEINIDEWKIALFVTRAYSYGGTDFLTDFHFLRQHNDGFWYHQDGYHGIISRCDSYNRDIKNPEKCSLMNRTYKKCLSLRLK